MPYAITEAAPLEYFTSKRGKEGWAVIAHQVALNSHYRSPVLVLDGYFGPLSEKIAKEVQTACSVTADGIVGPATQEAFVKAKAKHAEHDTTPPGLLAGLCKIESSYQWACVSPQNSDGSHDYGCTQDSKTNPAASELLVAFNPDAALHVLASEMHGYHKNFLAKVPSQRAWELAALAHNWPVAADKIANGEESWLNKPFAFTTAKGYATGLAYVQHYVQVATEQVTSWTVA